MRANRMLIFIAALECLGIAAPARAAVNVISVQHRVWGDAGDSPADTYDESGSAPVSGSANGTKDYGFYTGQYHAESSASDWSVNAYRIGDSDYANAYAQNTYWFTPFSRVLDITLNGMIGVWWFENQAMMELTDTTTNTLVGSYYSPSYTMINPFQPTWFDMDDYPFSWHASVDVDPLHEYELIIFVGAHRGEGGDGSASLNLTLVPEPGAALLAGMAAMCSCLLRKRPADRNRSCHGSQST